MDRVTLLLSKGASLTRSDRPELFYDHFTRRTTNRGHKSSAQKLGTNFFCLMQYPWLKYQPVALVLHYNLVQELKVTTNPLKRVALSIHCLNEDRSGPEWFLSPFEKLVS